MTDPTPANACDGSVSVIIDFCDVKFFDVKYYPNVQIDVSLSFHPMIVGTTYEAHWHHALHATSHWRYKDNVGNWITPPSTDWKDAEMIYTGPDADHITHKIPMKYDPIEIPYTFSDPPYHNSLYLRNTGGVVIGEKEHYPDTL